jgi:hypothetical protein
MSINNSIINSMIIGDGHIDKKGRICIQHSLKQKEWLYYKKDVLENSGYKVKFHEKEYYDSRKGKTFYFINMWTSSTFSNKKLRECFYPNDIKIIPKEISEDFGFEEWAIIYQDDGRCNKVSHYNTIKNGERVRVDCEPFVNRYEIYVNNFDIESIKNLQSSLLSLGIESKILHLKQGGYSIAISKAESKIKFYEGISPFIIESMKYKINTRPTLSYHF